MDCDRQPTHLKVGGVLFQVCFDAAAQLEDPAPLGLQCRREGLERGRLRGRGIRAGH